MDLAQELRANIPMNQRTRTIGLGLIFGLLFWIFEAAIDALYFFQGTFLELLLLDVPFHELFVRMMVIVLFLGFAWVLGGQRERTKAASEAAIEFGSAVMASGHAIYITDVDGTIEFVNPAFEEVTGYVGAEAIGRTPRILKSGEMSDEYYRELWATVANGDTWKEVVINKRKDGELYHAHQTIAPIAIDSELEGYVAIQTDITESEDLRNRLDSIIGNLPGVVYRCRNEPGWPMVYVGGDVPGVTGYPAETIESNEISWGHDVVHPDDREAVWEEVQSALDSDEPYRLTYRILTARGETKWVWEYGQTTSSATNEVELLDGYIMDISRERELEAELEQTIQQLQVLDRVLRHNLHNDMNVVMGYAQLIADEAEGELQSHAEVILREGEQLLAMADKERDISKTLAERPPSKAVELDRLLTEIVARYRERYPAARIDYANEDVYYARATNAIHLALNELIENAIKHSGADEPTVTIDVTKHEERVRIEVRDDGPPLSEMDRQVIFEGEDITPLKHGSGLGLWLVRIVVESANGQLGHEYREPGGNAFSIELASA